jgi:NAD(P)-binding Rossmann-like domain
MTERTLEADYVIVGAGAVAMAFADTLLTDTEASIVMVDRRHKPGGHWNDSYPFVRLHGPSINYGVNSRPLGTGRVDQVGLNKGLHELAGGHEICGYFDQVMRQRFQPSGRVTYLPLSNYTDDGIITSLATGERTLVKARKKIVDVTLADTRVPATHPPSFSVAPGVRCIPPNALVQLKEPCAGFVIIGAGKTSIDTVIWLLEQGVDPQTIIWIRPRDQWLINRKGLQISYDFFADTYGGLASEVESGRDATSIDDLFARLEMTSVLTRIDPRIKPTMYRCAIVSDAELEQLRRVTNVVRKGHVNAIEADRIILDEGEIPTSPQHFHVHCSADGIPRLPEQPIFQGNRIKVQYVRTCQPTFSGAFVAHVEATLSSDEEKNALCRPVPIPDAPIDWLRIILATYQNRAAWENHADLLKWLHGARLDGYTGMFVRAEQEARPENKAIIERYRQALQPGLARIAKLLATAG